jgi:CelD/BcsL family acetyltransferase involved in cellulose biosynthesis
VLEHAAPVLAAFFGSRTKPLDQVDVIRIEDVDQADLDAWRAILPRVPEFYSPLLTPEFPMLMARFRRDVRIAILRREGRAIAFLPFHLRPGGVARPIGSPFDDYQAIIADAEAEFDAFAFLAAAGLRRFSFSCLVDPQGRLAAALEEEHPGYCIRIADGDSRAYFAGLMQASHKRYKNIRRLDHKAEREIGEIRLEMDDRDHASLDRMLDWKASQMERTGVTNVLDAVWVRPMLHGVLDHACPRLRGQMITLWAGDTLLAGHFGIRAGEAYHPWIAAMSPDHSAVSPGQVFMGRLLPELGDAGIRILDLGTRHEHYKAPFSNLLVTVGRGVALANGAGRPLFMREDLIGRLAGRIEHMASAELTVAGRTRGLLSAAMRMGVRLKDQKPEGPQGTERQS